MTGTISEELLLSICGQNDRSKDSGGLGYTMDVMFKIQEQEPCLHEFIGETAGSIAANFCEDFNLTGEQQAILSVMVVHSMAMVANAYMVRDESKELQESIG